jgi:TonB family protein
MTTSRRSRFKAAALFALLAILFHVCLVVPIGRMIFRSMAPPPGGGEPVVVDLWGSAPLPEAAKTPEQELEEYEPDAVIPDGEVVRDPALADRRPPKIKPRFVASFDSRAEKETRSRFRTPGQENVAPAPQLGGQGADSETTPGGMRLEEDGVSPLPSDLERDKGGTFSTALRAPWSPEDVSLNPSRQAMAGAIAGSGLDYLEDVVDGDATTVNTAGWEYASFFNRVKSKVERFWKPGAEYRQRDPYGNIYGLKDRVTVLLVVLFPDGRLKKLYVMDSSGAPFLDDEAYEAVDQAAPFPNVPKGLRGKRDGLVKFTFHFVVEVGEAPIVRMRRYE